MSILPGSNSHPKIEYIPQEVWNQLENYLDDLPAPPARMIVVITSTGLRVGELLNLPFDCLRQRGEKWHLRFVNQKYQTENELPIGEDLLLIIKEQQQYIKHHFNDNYNYLFSSHVGDRSSYYTPKPNVMEKNVFDALLNKLAKKHNICTKEGDLWHFNSRQFRQTYLYNNHYKG
jgi:integrase/recombinase XerD